MDVILPLDQMSLPEKLRVLETLWDDLGRHDGELESPAWHEEILKERQARAQAGEAIYSDWEDARVRLRQQAP